MNIGNIITIVIVVATSAFTVGVTYNELSTVKEEVIRNTERIKGNAMSIDMLIKNQQESIQNINKTMVDEYVRSRELEQFRSDIGGRLDRMNDNIKYLIELQGGNQ